MPMPDVGDELRFSRIGTEFEDSNPIRLSHYFKNNSVINTSHISSFPDTYNEFKLSFFYGVSKEVVVDSSPTNNQSTITDWIGGDGNSSIEWLHGVRILNNRTTKENESEILDVNELTRGKVSGRDDRREKIIHARSGDTLRITGVIRVSSYFSDRRRISVYYKGISTGWNHIGTSGWQSGNYTHEITFNVNLPVGIYAILIAGYFSSMYSWGSVKKYTLEVW
jgi:hypothetical protein